MTCRGLAVLDDTNCRNGWCVAAFRLRHTISPPSSSLVNQGGQTNERAMHCATQIDQF